MTDLQSPFLFVPDGEQPPEEWLAAHPGWVKFPATFVPRTAGGPRTRTASAAIAANLTSPPGGRFRRAKVTPAKIGVGTAPPFGAGAVATYRRMNSVFERFGGIRPIPTSPVGVTDAVLRIDNIDAESSASAAISSGTEGQRNLANGFAEKSRTIPPGNTAIQAHQPTESIQEGADTQPAESESDPAPITATDHQILLASASIQRVVREPSPELIPVGDWTGEINNETARALDMGRKELRDALHRLKKATSLGPADNVLIHTPTGDVYFNGEVIGNLHDE